MNSSNDFSNLSTLGELQYPEFDDPAETVPRDAHLTQIWKQEPSEVDCEQSLARVNFGVVSSINPPASSTVDFEEYLQVASPERSSSAPSPTDDAVSGVSNASSLVLPGSHESIQACFEASTRNDYQVPNAVTQNRVVSPSTLQTPSFGWPSDAPGTGNVLIFGGPSTSQGGQTVAPPDPQTFWSGFGITPSFQNQSEYSYNLEDYLYPEIPQSFPNWPAQLHEEIHTSYAAASQPYWVNDGGFPPCDDSFASLNPSNSASDLNHRGHAPVDHHPRPMIFGWPGPDVDLPPESIPTRTSTSTPSAPMSRGTKRKLSPSSSDETDQHRSSPSYSSSRQANKEATCLWLIPDATPGTWVSCGESLTEIGLSTHLNYHLNPIRDGGECKGYDDDHFNGEHPVNEHSIPRVKCKWAGCQEEYLAPETYRHVRKHLGWLKVKCGKCGKEFARKDSLKRHYAQCRGKKND